MYESVFEFADVSNSYFSEIGVAPHEDVSNVVGSPLKYLPKNNALSVFLKPVATDESSKIIRARKTTNQS